MAADPHCGVEGWKFALSIVGYGGAAIAFTIGLRQYRRADYWKRSEFLAKEMKDFFDDPKVDRALTMIDWGTRFVKLDLPTPSPDPRGVFVTRKLQWEALRPHTMLSAEGSSDKATSDKAVLAGGSEFSDEEAAIRDAYDHFLNGLERCGNYVAGELLSRDDLDPYVGYWVRSIADTNCDGEDALWSAFLLAYIEFYAFLGIRRLFDEFGYDIRVDSPLMQTFVAKSSKPELARTAVAHVHAIQRTVSSEGTQGSAEG